MTAVLQKVSRASVTVEGERISECEKGFLVLLGVSEEDNGEDARLLADKISKLRVFEDSDDKMNLSVNDVGGTVLVVPNFTLMASYKKGNRPSFVHGAPFEKAEELYNFFCDIIKDTVPCVKKGKFRSHMAVELVNDGPVTMVLDSRVLRGERSI